MTTLTTRRFPSRAALDAALAERLARAIAAPGPSAIMLSGGTTPLPAYRALAQRPPPHDERLRLLFSDDRHVPADSDASNYYQSRPLLDALALAPAAVVRVRTELALDEAAADYERQLANLLNGRVPITLGLLGLGADGHTASLFGAADLERARGHLAIAVQRPDGMSAVSVTPDFLAHVEDLVFVVAGTGKRDAIEALVSQDSNLTAWRAVRGCPDVELWVCEGD
ncbi:MAG TPA: 6-phosphogluconolactonase [Steroidobacteraceae bacterium]|nr:6-phosphogluconolactonase [Steroidobacteraceae bacterium]